MKLRNSLRAARAVLPVCLLIAACGVEQAPEPEVALLEVVEPRPDIYADFTLTSDLSALSDNQKEMVRLLIDAAQIMDDLFWRQAYGDDYESWLESIADADTRTIRRTELRSLGSARRRTSRSLKVSVRSRPGPIFIPGI